MNQIQSVAANYFAQKNITTFNLYYKHFSPIVYRTSLAILRDQERAWENVNNIFLKMFQTTTFVFDNMKSHKSYMITMASNHAKMMYNRNKKSRFILESSILQAEDDEHAGSILDVINKSGDIDFNKKIDLTMVIDDSLLKEEIIKSINIITQKDVLQRQLLTDIFVNRLPHDEITLIYDFSDNKELESYINKFRRRITKIVQNSEYYNMAKYSIKPRYEEKDEFHDIEKDEENSKLFGRICSIVRALNIGQPDYNKETESGVLIDAMIHRISYDTIKETYNLNSVGCIKTRVCRAKSEILKLMQLDRNAEQLINAEGSDLTLKTRLFHDDGITVKAVFSLLNGELEGTRIDYYPTGIKKSIYNFKHGFKHGECIEYDESGNCIFTGKYNYGKKDDNWHIFEENNMKACEMEYLDGKLIFSKLYDEQGNITETRLVQVGN